LSDETKMTSSLCGLPAATCALYHSARRGVKSRQGGHQCAEKYSSTRSARASTSATVSRRPPSSGPATARSTSSAERGAQGKASGCVATPSRPLAVTTAPVARSTMTSVGMPRTLKAALSAPISSAPKGSAPAKADISPLK